MEEELVKSFAHFCLKDFAAYNNYHWTCDVDDDINECYDRILTSALTRYISKNFVYVRSLYIHLRPLIRTLSQFEYHVVDIAGTIFEKGYSADSFISFAAWTSYLALELNSNLSMPFPESAIFLLEDTMNYFICKEEFYGRGGGWKCLYDTARKKCRGFTRGGLLQEMVFYNKNHQSIKKKVALISPLK